MRGSCQRKKVLSCKISVNISVSLQYYILQSTELFDSIKEKAFTQQNKQKIGCRLITDCRKTSKSQLLYVYM